VAEHGGMLALAVVGLSALLTVAATPMSWLEGPQKGHFGNS
jgi:hypothetical protein